MRKRWIYVTVMVGLLTLAVTGGVAAANFGGPEVACEAKEPMTEPLATPLSWAAF
jgi:hypothetical protein